MNKILRRYLLLLPAVLSLALAACGGDSDSTTKNAQIRLLNVSRGYTSLDLYTNNGSDTDSQQFSGVGFDSVSSYASLKGDSYTLKFRNSGTTGNLLSMSATLAEETHTTYVAYGATNQFGIMSISEDVDAPDSGYAKVQVVNTTAANNVDVYLTGSNDSLDNVSATFSALAPATQATMTTLTSGSYRLRVTAGGSKTDLRLNVPAISLDSKAVVYIILTQSAGGVLVNAVVLPLQGQPTVYDNTDSAQIRLLNASRGYSSLDLYTNNGSTGTDTQQFSGVTLGSISDYAAVKADTYALKFRKSGTSGDLLTSSATLAEETHTTYVAYGATNRFGVLSIDEDVAAADSGYTKLQVLNAASDSLDVYLTGPNDSIDDVSATIGAVAAGSRSAASTLLSGTYRLRITGAGSKTDIRLDVPGIALASTGVLSIILTDTPGGVLVNAVVLPQQGAPTAYDNTTARIRGALGLSAGSAAGLNLAGTDIVANRPARSYIAPSYSTVAAGSAPFTVNVDGAIVTSGTATLEAGKDYTLLVWDSGGVVHTTLITDDNNLSTSNRAKVRLINGASGLAAPLTLSVNFSPIAEYIDVGTVSDVTEVDPGTDYELDVTNAQTLVTLLTRTSVSLDGGGVYTLFMAGGGSAAVVGTLREDR